MWHVHLSDQHFSALLLKLRDSLPGYENILILCFTGRTTKAHITKKRERVANELIIGSWSKRQRKIRRKMCHQPPELRRGILSTTNMNETRQNHHKNEPKGGSSLTNMSQGGHHCPRGLILSLLMMSYEGHDVFRCGNRVEKSFAGLLALSGGGPSNRV